MIHRPMFSVIAGTLLSWLLLFSIALGPWPAPWGLLFPTLTSALRLRDSQLVIRRNSCAWADLQRWNQLASAPKAASWFQAVAAEAAGPEGRLYGLAGLRATDSLAFLQALRDLRPYRWSDPVRVIDGDSVHEVPMLELLPELTAGGFGQRWSDEAQRPEC